MNITVQILLSVFLISSISLIGVFTLSLLRTQVKKITLLLVSFATGGLFGGAFLHLIPESYAQFGPTNHTPSLLITAGFLAFFILEKILRWRHCHIEDHDHVHPFVLTNLLGDGMHNFIDGMMIASSFLISPEAGIATTIAVMLHEIPQEIGDFGVLVHGGLSVKKALLCNFASSLLAFLGAGLIILFSSHIDGLAMYIMPITAGGFIYIAGSDLIPELHHENDTKKSILQLLLIVGGIALMYVLMNFFGHDHSSHSHGGHDHGAHSHQEHKHDHGSHKGHDHGSHEGHEHHNHAH